MQLIKNATCGDGQSVCVCLMQGKRSRDATTERSTSMVRNISKCRMGVFTQGFCMTPALTNLGDRTNDAASTTSCACQRLGGHQHGAPAWGMGSQRVQMEGTIPLTAVLKCFLLSLLFCYTVSQWQMMAVDDLEPNQMSLDRETNLNSGVVIKGVIDRTCQMITSQMYQPLMGPPRIQINVPVS